MLSFLNDSATTAQFSYLDSKSARDSKALASRVLSTLRKQNEISYVTINQNEADGLAALIHRAIPQVVANIFLSSNGANITASIELPLPKPIKFLNIEGTILPSEDGLHMGKVSVGSVIFEGDAFVNALVSLADLYLKGDVASKMIGMIKSIQLKNESLLLLAKIDTNLVSPHNKQSIFTQIRDDLSLFGEVSNIEHYYFSLVEFSSTLKGNKPQSLSLYVNHVFDLAKQRTGTFADEVAVTAVDENQSALLALALYFGSERFKLLIGEFKPLSAGDARIQHEKRATVTLRERVDLQKHFVYSAALELFSSQYASDALGEFKEFLDSNQGGSGFSFADLQADRAGTRLAMIVTGSETSAQKAQQILSSITDEQLLPSISGLKEGLSKSRFKQEYKTVNSDSYQKMLGDIDDRLKRLPLYRLGW
ncbi:hypothetical protein [Thalassotalea atypica]|uniref:hypothetical protein n=1 Tax=Thalassotalea atypica TaxID=2054316 RepID=UPI0025745977|nr:hypothetical protein [Thalassotalea atypica]